MANEHEPEESLRSKDSKLKRITNDAICVAAVIGFGAAYVTNLAIQGARRLYHEGLFGEKSILDDHDTSFPKYRFYK